MYKITHSKFIIKNLRYFCFLLTSNALFPWKRTMAFLASFSIQFLSLFYVNIFSVFHLDIHSLSLFHIDLMVRARCQLNTCLLTVA